MSKDNSVEDLKREAERRQDNLAADVDELLDRINPANATQRWKNELTGKGANFAAVDDGNGSSGLYAAVAGGVLGGLALVGGLAALVVQAKNKKQRKKEARFSAAVARMVAARESAAKIH